MIGLLRGSFLCLFLALILIETSPPAFSQFSGIRSKVEIVGSKRPEKPAGCPIEIFKDDKKPEKPHQLVARIDTYVRRNKITQGREAVYEEAVPELKKRACKAGAEAVIVLRQALSSSGEFKILYLKSEAIIFTEGSPEPTAKKEGTPN
jgi:hypothetical protein